MRVLSIIVVFLITVFLGDKALFFAARTLVRQSHNQFVEMYEGKGHTDILFLGDSRADRNISSRKATELTGKSCLNLGLGGNSVLISEILLRDYVDRYGNPATVVVELGHSTVDPATMGEMRIFAYCSTNIQTLARKIDPSYSMFETVFTSLRFNSPAFWRLAGEAVRPPATRLLHNTIPDVIVKKWKATEERASRVIYRENLAALQRICEFTDAHGIQIHLLIGPAWNDFKRAIVNFDEWKQALQQAAGKHTILDYSDVFVAHPEYFNDEMHLNSEGANGFVQKLHDDGVL